MSAVASVYRLAILAYFERAVEETATLDDLAEWIGQGHVDDTAADEVRLRLRCVDLPALAAAGVVEFDANTGTVDSLGTSSFSGQNDHAEFVVEPEGVNG